VRPAAVLVGTDGGKLGAELVGIQGPVAPPFVERAVEATSAKVVSVIDA
jgi:hypothetical protein